MNYDIRVILPDSTCTFDGGDYTPAAMARPLRIEYPGAIHHVTSRGNGRATVFRNEDERLMFYHVLASVVRDYNWICHAECQMGNHYHLDIETPDANLSAGMRQLNGVFTQRLNRARRTIGHVFQGRFGSRLIGTEEYFLEVCRYVVLNPVRAGLVADPGDWPWSSYRATAGFSPVPPFLTTGSILSRFGPDRNVSSAEYRKFVYEGIGAASPFRDKKSPVLGSDSFALWAREKRAETANIEIPRRERLVGRPRLDEIVSNAAHGRRSRDLAIWEAWALHGYSMADIARTLGIHYATVSRVLRRKAETATDAVPDVTGAK